MGAGTTAVAAVRTGRLVIGCELESSYLNIARTPIAAETADTHNRWPPDGWDDDARPHGCSGAPA
jgi:hypothetical protein